MFKGGGSAGGGRKKGPQITFTMNTPKFLQQIKAQVIEKEVKLQDKFSYTSEDFEE